MESLSSTGRGAELFEVGGVLRHSTPASPERQGVLPVSGVFEGVAGEAREARTRIDGEQSCTNQAFEFFKDKPLNLNDFLRQESRDVYVREVDYALYGSGSSQLDAEDSMAKFTRAGTMKQLQALSDSRKVTELEAPVERVQRLQGEISDMLEFIETYLESRKQNWQAESKATDDHSIRQFFGADPNVLLEELRTLQSHLEGIATCEALKIRETPDQLSQQRIVASSGKGEDIKRIGEQLERLSAETAGAAGATIDSKGFTYEVFAIPDAENICKVGRLIELEKRIAEMEVSLGIQDSRNLPYKDITSAIKDIATRLSLLHPSRVEVLNKRLVTLIAQIDELTHRRERLGALRIPSATGQQQQSLEGGGNSIMVFTYPGIQEDLAIMKLYDFYESSRHALSALPVVVNRLKVLKSIHQNAAAFSARLAALETQQVQVSNLLDSAEASMDILQGSVNLNLECAKTIINKITEKKIEK